MSGDGKSCECAVTVSDAWQTRGWGALLMRRLIDAARANGVRRMYAVDAAGCEKTHRLARCLGFQRQPDPVDPAAITYELVL